MARRRAYSARIVILHVPALPSLCENRISASTRSLGALKGLPFSLGSLERGKGALQIPRLPPDFLSSFVAPVKAMRLSSEKAAYVVADESSAVGNPEFARDDKG
jgi:hypothetical protein